MRLPLLRVLSSYVLACLLGVPALAQIPTFDIRENPNFDLDELAEGASLLVDGEHAPSASPKEVVVLIHGVHEDGSSWDEVLPKLVDDRERRVYFYHWSGWTPIHQTQAEIGHGLNALIAAYKNRADKITVIAHSAGGALLLKSLCYVPGSETCVYRPGNLGTTELRYHTIASPLGGMGHDFGADGVALFAGAVIGFIGQTLSFADAVEADNLTVWYTAPGTEFVQVTATSDNRFPVFTDAPIHYKKIFLPGASHVSAVSDAIDQIFGF